ncbi:MAG TPA: hexose kinase [Candidatus Coproplasma stercoravium]|nr:hexose kinase [Candidatus Coproplasma stercoravium]
MILSICLSPCIDVNMEVDSLSVGKLNKILNKRIYYTGKAINAARGLKRLGAEVQATGFMYEDNGRLFEQELHYEGVPYKFVWCPGRVRENYKFVDNKSMLTEVDDISPEVSEEKKAELIERVRELSSRSEAVILSGGLAKGMSPSYYGEVLSAVPAGVKKIVDTYGERLFESLKCGVELVKPNLQELQNTLRITINSKEEALYGCRELLKRGAKYVLLSLGKEGAILTDGSKSYYCKSINVAMNSTIGAGDGMVAAAAFALVKGYSMPDILRCGVAGGTAAVTTPDSITFKREKYEEILSGLEVHEIG